MANNFLTKRGFLVGLETNVVASSGNDIPNLTQVTALIKGLGIAKKNVRVTTDTADGNITLSGLQTIDTVVLVAGDRVLVRHQTNAVENGIYVAADGAWTRAADADELGELFNGSTVVPFEGTHADHRYMLVCNDYITPGTDEQSWVHDISITGDAGDITVSDASFGALVGTNVQTALDSADNELVSIHTLAGTSDVNLATFTGDIIADNSSIKVALQALETNAVTANGDIDDLESFIGSTGSALPTYANDRYVADNDTLVAAIDKLDAEIYANRRFEILAQTVSETTPKTITHNLNETRLSSIIIYDTTGKVITDTLDIVIVDANSFTITKETAGDLIVDVACRI